MERLKSRKLSTTVLDHSLFNTMIGMGARTGNFSFGVNYRFGFGSEDRANHSLNANFR